MTRSGWFVCMLLVWQSVAAARGREPGRPHVLVRDSQVRSAVERAIVGARYRLARPDCQQVLTDFNDQSGRPLLADLEMTEVPADRYLLERIWFVDGADTPACAKDSGTAAVTAAGSKVIRICAAGFGRASRQGSSGELLIIHELLHTLGLGENPPSTEEITRRVTQRCGGS